MNESKETIHIAQIIGKWVGGGVEAVVMNYYRCIDRSKIQFDFICDEDSTNIPFNEIESLGGKVILIPPYQKIFKYYRKLKKVLEDGNYKIVHSHINTLSVFSLYAAKSAGVPIRIAHAHSTTNPKERKKNFIKQILRHCNSLFATNYMCCSEIAGRWLFGKKYDLGQVYLLYNAIDLNKYMYNKQVRNIKRAELGIKNDMLVLGHIGRFVEQKNHRFLIDIFNEFHKMKRNSILILIGQGPLKNEMKEKVNSLGLMEYVLFLGQREDANDFYQAFDVFLFPSLYEGLGMALIEAQVSGLSCIASTEVPMVAKITDNVKFLNLNNAAQIWAHEIWVNDKRKEQKILNYENYDIFKECRKLENYYLKELENEN